MATLVLSTVGAMYGGPIGRAVGAVVGLAIDQMIFAPKPRHGPRLGDVGVQTSSYGSQIPKMFGTMRAAGTVIWATDLVETKAKSGGGKGRPKTINYSYAANFAVALSARRVRAVRRIWADGKLLRGAEGDFKTGVGAFRLHLGDEDQALDPLIAAQEGAGAAPAYRGLAYAVFEGLQLEDYGNRIPSLSFEIEADAAPVPVASIATELSEGAIAAGASPAIAGYAATGDSVRSAVETLAEPLSLVLTGEAAGLVLGIPSAAPVLLPRRACSGIPETSRRAAGTVPGEVSLSYYDPGLDHQAGLQRARRDGPAARSEARGLAAAIAADEAKRFAEARLASLWAARHRAKVRLGWRHLPLRPGACVRIEGEPGRWLIERWQLGAMTLDLELVRLAEAAAAAAAPPATPGRNVPEHDFVHGATVLRLLDLPLPYERDGAWLAAIAAGPSPGWRRALLTASFDGGASWADLGATAQPGILGTAQNALGAGGAALIDTVSSVEVELLHDGMWLESRTDEALAGGANMAAIGSELIQFGRAERIGERRFRLSRLLRGRRGTEWAAADHAAGDGFALIESDALFPVPVPAGAVGADALLVAAGVGDGTDGVSAARPVTGEALRPPAPVHLRGRVDANGDLAIQWTRRSRTGWTWASGSDTPLAEEKERYLLTLAGGAGERTFDLAEPSFLYAAPQQAQDGLTRPIAISVVQIGTHAASRPAQAILA